MLKVMQTGFLGSNPELHRFPDGEVVARVSVATNSVYTDRESGEVKTVTTWVRWEAWGKSAENIEKHLKSGSRVYFEGTLRNRKWKDKATGADRYGDTYRILYWENLDRKPSDEGHSGSDAGSEGGEVIDYSEHDLPAEFFSDGGPN
jgi:single-strand DNA-binding protein